VTKKADKRRTERFKKGPKRGKTKISRVLWAAPTSNPKGKEKANDVSSHRTTTGDFLRGKWNWRNKKKEAGTSKCRIMARSA